MRSTCFPLFPTLLCSAMCDKQITNSTNSDQWLNLPEDLKILGSKNFFSRIGSGSGPTKYSPGRVRVQIFPNGAGPGLKIGPDVNLCCSQSPTAQLHSAIFWYLESRWQCKVGQGNIWCLRNVFYWIPHLRLPPYTLLIKPWWTDALLALCQQITGEQ